MRIESSVTSVTWIPSEAISGMPKLPFELGLTHYDDPLPDQIDDLEELRKRDAFREANDLRAWIHVEDGKIVDSGYSGCGHIGRDAVEDRAARACLRGRQVSGDPARARGT